MYPISNVKFNQKGFCEICHTYKDNCITFTETDFVSFNFTSKKHIFCKEHLKDFGLRFCECGQDLVFIQKDK